MCCRVKSIIGIAVLIIGILLTIYPQWISAIPKETKGYELIEKRVGYGFLIGFGIFTILYQHNTSWKTIVCLLLFSFTLGVIVARSIGLLVNGFFLKQFLWLGIEFIILLFFAILYHYADH